MTLTKHVNSENRKSQSTADGDKSGRPLPLSRRTLLKAGATAMPLVLTLQSGEALARSSNLISAAPGQRNENRKALCLDTSTAEPVFDGHKYDLHDPGYATVNVIRDADYYPVSPDGDGGRSGDPIGADDFCELGGGRQYHDGGWHQVDLPTNGIIVSANSLHSVSSRVDIYLNYLS